MNARRPDLSTGISPINWPAWLEPPIFNYLIMVLYGVNVVHYLIFWRLDGAAYWVSALAITAAVTWSDVLREL